MILALSVIYFSLISVALTNVIVNASILEPFRVFIESKSRFFGSLLRCMLCSGLWVGLIISPFFSINIIAGALLSSLLGDMYSTIFGFIETLTSFIIGKASSDDDE